MKVKIMIICMAGLVIMLPVITKLLGAGNIYTIDENRNRIEKPTIDAIKMNGFSAVNDWYNDNFGLRDLLIRLQHQMDYSLFKYSKNLFFSDIDGDEYLHYRSVVASEQINNERVSDEKKEAIVTTFKEIKNVLENQEIVFKFIIPPQKNEVLIDADRQLPINRPDDNMYLQMQEKFKSSELAGNYVNILDVLRVQNKVAPVFYKADFHWNDWGAAVAFGEVVNSYANDLGLGNVYSLNNFEYSTFKPGYNFAQLASLSVLKYNILDEITVNKNLDYYSKNVQDSNYSDYVIWENTETAVFDKAVLFIGDSYTPPALFNFNNTHSGIVELFPKVYFCHWDHAQGALLNIPEDVGLVVVEAIESNYSYMDTKGEVLLEGK